MSEKSKKAKAPKDKSGGKKDRITGLSVQLAGLTFQSDVTYDHLSPQGKLIFANDVFSEGGQGLVEIELSKSDAVITIARNKVLLPNGSTGDNYSRTATIGSYTFDDQGRFKGGLTTEASQSTYYDYQNTPTSNEYPAEWILVFQGNASRSTDFYSLQRPDFWPAGKVYDYNYVNQKSQTDYTRSELSNYKSAPFYQEGWWNNPFSTNLI